MYFKEYNLYINDENKVLFDLNNCDIYELNEEFYTNFKRVYKGGLIEDFPEIEQFINDKIQIKSSFEKYNENLNTIKINVSHGCNLRCSYCYAGNGDYGDKGLCMNRDIAQRISYLIDNYALNVNKLTFFGGEPTLNLKIIKYFCEKYPDFTFFIQTNGTTLMNPNFMDLVNNYNFKITLSIDGPQEVHDKQRIDAKGNPTYERIRHNVKNISPIKIDSIQATYTPNSEQLYSKKEIAQLIYNDFGVTNIAVNDVWDGSPLKYEIDVDKIEEQFNDFLNPNPYYMRTRVADILSIFFSKDVDWYHFCDASLSLVSIDPNGDIWPCHLFVKTSEKIANINDDFDYVWKKISAYPELFHQDTKDNDICSNCIARFRCRSCKRTEETPYKKERCELMRFETVKVLDLIAENNDKIDKIVTRLDKVINII
ncbi:radical SAM/SPASM domain-containing protein [Bacillus andreraoultii]|uniref:radical SAM/SPASM domain-containing protein n=1 Tax=Bacillus andreraoultii TaxID=1499685 RepID=UPI00053B4EA6|nr:radical SAM protein [Bacillus andreraoultii]